MPSDERSTAMMGVAASIPEGTRRAIAASTCSLGSAAPSASVNSASTSVLNARGFDVRRCSTRAGVHQLGFMSYAGALTTTRARDGLPK
jgi:hypothetical protein